MSDLAATQCGSDCGCSNCNGDNNNGLSLIWLLILLEACGCNNGSGFGNARNGLFGGDNGCCWIILLLLFCNGCNN